MEGVWTVNMPDIGEGVVEGEVIEWLKNVGDALLQDEPVVVLMTDKATVELPSPKPGVLAKQYYKTGQIAVCGKPLYDIQAIDLSEGIPKAAQEMHEPRVPKLKGEKAAPRPLPSSGSIFATPPVRHLAKELGIPLDKVVGTGKDGRITVGDLKSYCSPSSKSALKILDDDEVVPLNGIRRQMALRMHQSNQAVAHFSYFEQVDATRLIQLRQSIKKDAFKEDIHLTYMPFVIRALTLTLKKHPLVNSSLDLEGGRLFIHRQHHMGIAMATSKGLIVPVLHSVQNLNLEEIIHAYEELKHKALQGKLTASDMKDATISISNFGVLGGGATGLWATPVINPPEAAILAIAKIQPQPVVINEEVVVRATLNLSWSFDHRIVDGELATVFSHDFSALLTNPAGLL